MDVVSETIDDLPYGGLTPADPSILKSAPLELAVVEVRFSSSMAEVAADDALAVRDKLVELTSIQFPVVQQAVKQQFQLTLSTEAPVQADTQTRGWHIQSADGRRLVTLMPDAVVLQVNEYERWRTTMREPLEVLLAAAADMLSPSVVHRVGLRYVDRFRDPQVQAPAGWADQISESLLGPIHNPVFGTRVAGSQQQVEINLDDNRGALLRHGPVQDQSSAQVDYVLDIDVFDQNAGRFDPAEILRVAVRLNRTALTLFQSCLTGEYLTMLKGEGS